MDCNSEKTNKVMEKAVCYGINAIHQVEEEEDRPQKLVLGQPHRYEVLVSNFIFLASAYEGRWPVLSLYIK